jgi:hypothetical protein
VFSCVEFRGRRVVAPLKPPCIIHIIHREEDEAMFENPVAKRTAIAAGIGALIAIPVPFVGPILGAVVGGAYGFATAGRRG